MLPLVLQIGPVQIEPVTLRLLRVGPGSDEQSVLDAILHAGGSLDGTRHFFWVDPFKLRQLEAELRASGDYSDHRKPASGVAQRLLVVALRAVKEATGLRYYTASSRSPYPSPIVA